MAPVDVHAARRVAGAITGGALVVAALAVVRTLFYGAVATAALVLFVVGVLVAAGWLLRTSARPWAGVVGLGLVAWGAIYVAFGCPGVGCVAAAGTEPHLRAFVRWTATGPGLALTTAPPNCPAPCAYTLELIPLGAGFGLVAASVSRTT